VYVNDPSAAHRAHASGAVTHFIPVRGRTAHGEGRSTWATRSIIRNGRSGGPGRRGAGKIDVIERLFSKVDALLVGGGMVYTFYRALGFDAGGAWWTRARGGGGTAVARRGRAASAGTAAGRWSWHHSAALSGKFCADPGGWIGVDIVRRPWRTSRAHRRRQTVLWNGPIGSEIAPFRKGTKPSPASPNTKNGATTVVGGEMAAAMQQLGLADRCRVSTGGGASLEFLEGRERRRHSRRSGEPHMRTPLVAVEDVRAYGGPALGAGNRNGLWDAAWRRHRGVRRSRPACSRKSSAAPRSQSRAERVLGEIRRLDRRVAAACCAMRCSGSSSALERRQHFGEQDATVARRCAPALDAGLKVSAVGETLAERDAGRTRQVWRPDA
jgi:hypothetical protein